MLANGVERIIEQVVNPKIETVFKPEVDKVVCEHLGIDPEELKRKQEEKKRNQFNASHSKSNEMQNMSPGASGTLISAHIPGL